MMIQLGRWNDLTITRFTDHGAYVDGGETGEILMPRSYVKPEMRPGDVVHVFVYLDQEERLVATMEQPLAQVGEFAFLRVAWVNQFGAFLDWGLMKDLFVPFSEQKRKMAKGYSYLVHVHIDPETRRIVGSAKVDRYLEPAPASYHKDREVDVLVWQRSPLGYKVIVDNRYSGLIYGDQVYDELHTGDRLRAHVVQIRPDGKLAAATDGASAVICGMGIGDTPATAETVRFLLDTLKCPLLLDADALNALSKDLSVLDGHRQSVVITPHIGEMSRLIKKDTAFVKENK